MSFELLSTFVSTERTSREGNFPIIPILTEPQEKEYDTATLKRQKTTIWAQKKKKKNPTRTRRYFFISE